MICCANSCPLEIGCGLHRESQAMQGIGGTNGRSETRPRWDATPSANCQALDSLLETLSNQNLVYNLRNGKSDSNGFYAETAEFAEKLVARIDNNARPILDGYCRHLRVYSEEAPRSRGEYIIEFLTLGMALRRYETAAQTTSRWVVSLAHGLILLRRHMPIFKTVADWLRARLSRHFFLPSILSSRECQPLTRSDLEHPGAGSPSARLLDLIRWLKSTGEYEEEALRLSNWRDYLATLTAENAVHCMSAAVESFDDFASEAASRLGTFTAGVNRFLSGEYARRSCREDQIFCGRPPVEYHLNMLAAEVMNRGLQGEFERTTSKVVLVPVCMRGARTATCQARLQEVDVECMACDPECTVNRITQRMRKLDARVYLVPHSTGFSRWLARWESEPGVGVTAVACMLNILPGGYEMRSRGIASQCVPLDYPGCKKHWDQGGLPTAVNEDRLVQIIAGAAL